MYLKNNPPTDQTIVTNVSKFVEKWKKEKNTWLGFGIVAAVVLFIILLIVLVLRKRIKIAIALVKEGSKYEIKSRIRLIHFLIDCFSISEPSVRSHQRYFSQYFHGSFKSQSSVLRSSSDCIWLLSAIQSIKLFVRTKTQTVYAQDRHQAMWTVQFAVQPYSTNTARTHRRQHLPSLVVRPRQSLANLPPVILRSYKAIKL